MLIPSLLGAGLVGLAAASPATAADMQVATDAGTNIPPESETVAPNGTSGVPYEFQFVYGLWYLNGTYIPITDWSVSGGQLPPGLTLDSTGLLSGTPTEPGTYSLRVDSRYPFQSGGSTAVYVKHFDLTIEIAPAPPPSPVGILNSPPSMLAGTPYSFTFAANCYPGSCGSTTTFSLDPTFYQNATPPGTSLAADGTLSGTPTTPGTYTFKVRVSNASGSNAWIYQMRVNASATVAGSPTDATVGAAYSYGFTTSGYPAPSFAITSGTLPTALNIDAGTATITGTPTKAGQYPFTVTGSIVSQWGDDFTSDAANSTALTVQPATGGQAQVATAPASVKPGAWESDSSIRVFGETYNTVLTAPLAIGGKTIPAGTKVNSYYVHADPVGNANTDHRYTGSVSFGTKIVAVATSTADLQATHVKLGKPGVTYSTSTDQALEYNDAATTGTTVGKVNLDFHVYDTSDAVRVITLAP
jgi:hypothetical protein